MRNVPRWITAVSLVALLAIGSLATLSAWRSESRGAISADIGVSPLDLLAASASSIEDEFARVPSPWVFTFPDDHGRHEQYRTESWNLTGTLRDEGGRLSGAQLLLVRIGLRAQAQEQASAWAASEIYAALFSLSDPVSGRLYTDSRLSRGALGLAGATSEPIELWVEDFRVEGAGIAEEAVDLAVRVRAADVQLDLELSHVRPLIDASELGTGGAQQGALFQFYVQPRMNATGTISFDAREGSVEGVMSLEHAWGELPLPGGPLATDRFTLHLDDQRALFAVRTHRTGGAGAPSTTALLIDRNARPELLSNDDMELHALAFWTSSRTGARYPIRWRLRIPAHDVDVELVPRWEDQEGNEWVSFWAGPVTIEDLASATKAGDGHVQLYGYGAP